MRRPTGGPTPTARPARDELAGARLDAELPPPRLRALSTALARHLRRYYGRGPMKAAGVRLYDGYVDTVQEPRLTRADPSLVEKWAFAAGW